MLKIFRPAVGCRPLCASFQRTFHISHQTRRTLLSNTRPILVQCHRHLSSAPKENIYTVPNLLTLSRIVATPLIGYLIVEHCYYEASIALLVASATDVLDGWIARRCKQQTYLGSVLDPMADKVLMTTLVLSLAHADLIPGISLFNNIMLTQSSGVGRPDSGS